MEIPEILAELKEEARAITTEVTELSFHSNGAASWSEVWAMSHVQRKILMKTIKDFHSGGQ